VLSDTLVLGVHIIEIHTGIDVNSSGKRPQFPIRNAFDLIGGLQILVALRQRDGGFIIYNADQVTPNSYFPIQVLTQPHAWV